jgi:preprotein translocase subunit YajC
MHLLYGISLLVASTTKTTTSSSSSTGSSSFLLIIIVLFALAYFFMIRPNQRRKMQAMRQARAFDLGDEVVAGGMVGRVVRLGEGSVDVEVSDGVVVQFVPQAVQSRAGFNASQAGRGRGGFGARLSAGSQPTAGDAQPPSANGNGNAGSPFSTGTGDGAGIGGDR